VCVCVTTEPARADDCGKQTRAHQRGATHNVMSTRCLGWQNAHPAAAAAAAAVVVVVSVRVVSGGGDVVVVVVDRVLHTVNAQQEKSCRWAVADGDVL
jgi:hypothetical protein